MSTKYVPTSVDDLLEAGDALSIISPGSAELFLLQWEHPKRYLNSRPFPPKAEETEIIVFNHRIRMLRDTMRVRPMVLHLPGT